MKDTKVQILGLFLLFVFIVHSTEILLLTVFQLACNQKIVLLTSLEVFITSLAPQNARHAHLYNIATAIITRIEEGPATAVSRSWIAKSRHSV